MIPTITRISDWPFAGNYLSGRFKLTSPTSLNYSSCTLSSSILPSMIRTYSVNNVDVLHMRQFASDARKSLFQSLLKPVHRTLHLRLSFSLEDIDTSTSTFPINIALIPLRHTTKGSISPSHDTTSMQQIYAIS